jgi:hypothetical protein
MTNDQTSTPLLLRYSQQPAYPALSYATVRDYCDSVEAFPWLSTRQNDLKDVERPWAVKAVLNCLPPGSSLLEVGGGEPFAAATLVSLGYDVTLCDPFDGSGNGPLEFEAYRAQYPAVKFLRSLFTPALAKSLSAQFDGIFSISVLEHVKGSHLEDVFAATEVALKPGGYSIHVIDHVLEGMHDAWHETHVRGILKHQVRLSGSSSSEGALTSEFQALLARARNDLETFYNSPQAHNNWRGGQPYDTFPFRKCIAIQSIARRAAIKQPANGSIRSGATKFLRLFQPRPVSAAVPQDVPVQ